MMKRLIVRADDIGISEAVTLGILSAFEHGIVTCAGMMVNMEYAPQTAKLMKEYPKLCLGLHTNLIVGKPCSSANLIPKLVDSKGELISSKIRREQISNGIDPFVYGEVKTEIIAQVERFIELYGKIPEYIDSHAVATHTTDQAILDVAKVYGIDHVPISGNKNTLWRRVGVKVSQYEFYKGPEALYKYFNETNIDLKDGEIGLIVTHPGFLDQQILDISSMTFDRLKDHDLLVAPQVALWLREHDISLISFRDLEHL